ncbi:MAG: radical SAM protein [Dehalococcoidia bacterium]|nr:radical SAM protein [Dehalococcoidia bacterium]
MSIIYGPVASWRLGSSLGIDLLSVKEKTCSFNCIYCQLGRTLHLLSERREFVSLTELNKELDSTTQIEADYVTFSGTGEPTLGSNLGRAIEIVRSTMQLPIAVLTNSSLMPNKDVRRELSKADVVIAKLDAPNEELFTLINRPVYDLRFRDIIEGIKSFRDEYKGKLALQMMFMGANRDYASAMAKVAADISPDEVQINTPLRPCGVTALPPEEIAAIRRDFVDFDNVATVYEAPRHEAVPLNLAETLWRRPKL